MANNSILKAAIADVVKQNGTNAITGNLLQQSLLSMIDALGGNYQYAGIATPTTNPGTPDQNVFYLAATAGTYTNFGGIVLAAGEVAVLKGTGSSWTKENFPVASVENVDRVASLVSTIKRDFGLVSGQTVSNNIIKIYPVIPAGQQYTILFNSEVVSSLYMYVKYTDGTYSSGIYITIGTPITRTESKNIDYITCWVNSAPSADGVLSITITTNNYETIISKLEDKDIDLQSQVGFNSLDVNLVSGTAIGNGTYKNYVDCPANTPLYILFTSSVVSSIPGVYVYYKDGTHASTDATSGTVKQFTPTKDVDYVSFYIPAPSSNGTMTFAVGNANNHESRIKSLEDKDPSISLDIIQSHIGFVSKEIDLVSGNAIGNLTYKNYVDCPAYKSLYILFETSVVNDITAVYCYFKDGTSASVPGVTTPGVVKKYTPTKDVDFISFYLAAPSASGKLIFSVANSTNLEERVTKLESLSIDSNSISKSFTLIPGQATNAGQFKIPANIKAGEHFDINFGSDYVATIGLYIHYKGDVSETQLSASFARYTIGTFVANKDADYLTFSASSTNNAAPVDFQVDKHLSFDRQLDGVNSHIMGIQKTIIFYNGVRIGAWEYKLYPDIKAGETIRYKFVSSDLEVISAAYLVYKNGQSVSLSDRVVGKDYFYKAENDVDFFTFTLNAPSGNGSFDVIVSRIDTLQQITKYVEQIPIIQQKKVLLSVPQSGKIMLFGDSISSSAYPWYADWMKQYTGVNNVYAGGFPGYNVEQLTADICLQRIFDYAPNVLVILLGANDVGDVVGTFGQVPGQEIVEDVDISQEYSGTYFIQAVSYILRKVRNYYYDIITRSGQTTPIDMDDDASVELIDNVLLPYIAVCTTMPEKLYGPGAGYARFNSKENQTNKRNAIVEVCNKYKFHCIDFYNLVDIDWSLEPYYNTPTDTQHSNGIYTMDGLHPNKWGCQKMSQIVCGELNIKTT